MVPSMISNQETLNFSPYMANYDIVVLKDNILRQIEELRTEYCLDNGRNAIPLIRMLLFE